MSNRPTPAEYAPYFETYISLVPEAEIDGVLAKQADEIRAVMGQFESPDLEQLQEPYTWTPKQVIGHMIDTERVMGYRAATVAASDDADLPGFDQDEFVDNADYNAVELNELLAEFETCRQSHVALFRRLPAAKWAQAGKADGKPISVRALAYLMAGHVRHHLAILEKRSSAR